MRFRFLHTADWHLGQSFYGLSREREHRAFLDWLLDRLDDSAANALLVTGDVFDSANPSTSALNLFYQFLADARSRRPALQILITAGNHDSGSRLEAPAPLLRELGVHVVGGLSWRAAGDPDLNGILFPLQDDHGQLAAVCAAVPYLRACDLAAVAGVTPASAGNLAMADETLPVRILYQQVVRALRAAVLPTGAAPLLTGHCTVVGGELSTSSERRVLAGGLHGVPADLFPEDMAYVALGHLHRAQKVAGRDGCRYSGSPLPLAMDEVDYRHQVLAITLEKDSDAGCGQGDRGEGGRGQEWRRCVTVLPVPRAVPILRLPAAGPPQPVAATLAAVHALAATLEPVAAPPAVATPPDLWPYLDVAVALERPEPGLREKVLEILKDRAVRLVRLVAVQGGDGAGLRPETLGEDLASLQPEEVFCQLHLRTHGAPPSEELVAAFRELLAEVESADVS